MNSGTLGAPEPDPPCRPEAAGRGRPVSERLANPTHEQFQLRSKEFEHKTEQQEWEKHLSSMVPNSISQDISEEEIELELLQRKEAVKKNFSKEKSTV